MLEKRKRKEGITMTRKVRLLLAVLALLAALLCGFGAWRVYEGAKMDAMYRAVLEVWNQTATEDTPAYLQAIDRRTEFVLEKIEKGNPYVLTVTVYGVDLGGKLRETDPAAMSGLESEQAINDYLTGLVEQSGETEVQTILYAWPEGDGYRIQFSDTFIDAMSGMVYSYFQDMINGATGGMQG